VKHYERDKRDVGLERSLELDLDRSASGFAAWLAVDQTSPSGRAERNEELLRMVEALAELPELMREVVVLKHCQGWTLPRIAERTIFRRLRAAGEGRTRRDGNCVQGSASLAQPARRAQDDPPRHVCHRKRRRTVPRRGRGGGQSRPSPHRADLRGRGTRRSA